MKIRFLTQFLLTAILICSNSLNAQYDDVYFDPDKNEREIYEKRQGKAQPLTDNEYNSTNDSSSTYSSENYKSNQTESVDKKDDEDSQANTLDDEMYGDDDYEYYYSSRIKRFHRPYYTRDFYDPFYTDLYYYDYYFDPFYVRDIYAYSDPYWDYYRYRRWNRNFNQRWNYWNSWNWYFGYYPYGPAWSYNFYYNPWYFNYYSPWYNDWYGYGWGGQCGWYNRSAYYDRYNHGHNDGYSSNPKGKFYGSRRGGLTHTSKNGPVRFQGFSPRVGKLDKNTAPDNYNNNSPRRARKEFNIDDSRPDKTIDRDNSPRRDRKLDASPKDRSNPFPSSPNRSDKPSRSYNPPSKESHSTPGDKGGDKRSRRGEAYISPFDNKYAYTQEDRFTKDYTLKADDDEGRKLPKRHSIENLDRSNSPSESLKSRESVNIKESSSNNNYSRRRSERQTDENSNNFFKASDSNHYSIDNEKSHSRNFDSGRSASPSMKENSPRRR